jgi:pyruvate dehydrogenase E1 component beta subunit
MTGSARISFAQGINLALDEAMAADPSVFLLGEDIADEQGGGVFKATLGLSKKYGVERVRATPISEQAIVGAAVGAAITGMRPVAEIMFMNFLTVCMDQIVNHAAKLRFMSGGLTAVPLTIRCGTGAGVGFGGQHSDMLEAWFAHVPGMKVVTASRRSDAGRPPRQGHHLAGEPDIGRVPSGAGVRPGRGTRDTTPLRHARLP